MSKIPITPEGERQLIKAMGIYVERMIKRRLPEGMQGIHAPVLSSSVIEAAVLKSLGECADSLARRVVEGS